MNLTETKQALEHGEKLYRGFKDALDVVLKIEQLDALNAQADKKLKDTEDALDTKKAQLARTSADLTAVQVEAQHELARREGAMNAFDILSKQLTEGAAAFDDLKAKHEALNAEVSSKTLELQRLTDAVAKGTAELEKINTAVKTARDNLNKLLKE